MGEIDVYGSLTQEAQDAAQSQFRRRVAQSAITNSGLGFESADEDTRRAALITQLGYLQTLVTVRVAEGLLRQLSQILATQ
jgi:hypothetical protein